MCYIDYKTRKLIEKLAISTRDSLEIDEGNNCKQENIVRFMDDIGCKLSYNKNTNYYSGNGKVIHLNFEVNNSGSYIGTDKLKPLLFGLWNFIEDCIKSKGKYYIAYYDNKDTSEIKIKSNYFTRAVLMPEEQFMQKASHYLDSNGQCNIFEVAEVFGVDYIDVITRGNELELWKKR